MDFKTPKVVCGVCNGKGGFRKLKDNFLDTNWIDCAYCEGYGFVDDTTTEEEVTTHLTYNRYKTKLESSFSILGELKVVTSESEKTDMFVKILPYNRKNWTTLIKHILKFSHHHDKIKVLPKQAFYHTDDETHYIDWELHITMHTLEDLDGLLELVRMYNDTLAVGGGI
jgi:hypothetical protein